MASSAVLPPLIPLPDDSITLTYRKRKVASVLMRPTGQVTVEVFEQELTGEGQAEVLQEVSQVFRTAALKTHEEAVAFLEDDHWASTPIPVNEGSLYDDVVFEAGIYVDSYEHVVVNTTFGRQCSPTVKLHQGLLQMSKVLSQLAEEAEERALYPREEL